MHLITLQKHPMYYCWQTCFSFRPFVLDFESLHDKCTEIVRQILLLLYFLENLILLHTKKCLVCIHKATAATVDVVTHQRFSWKKIKWKLPLSAMMLVSGFLTMYNVSAINLLSTTEHGETPLLLRMVVWLCWSSQDLSNQNEEQLWQTVLYFGAFLKPFLVRLHFVNISNKVSKPDVKNYLLRSRSWKSWNMWK